jgi:hypothetical protein
MFDERSRPPDWIMVLPAVVVGICAVVVVVGPPLRWLGWSVIVTVLFLNGWGSWEFGIKPRVIRRRARLAMLR